MEEEHLEQVPHLKLDLSSFAKKLYSFSTPPEPRSLDICIQHGSTNVTSVVPILQTILNYGMGQLHGKTIYQVHELEDDEHQTMRRYFHSFGWDFEMVSTPFEKEVTDYREDGSSYIRKIRSYNRQVLFKPYSK